MKVRFEKPLLKIGKLAERRAIIYRFTYDPHKSKVVGELAQGWVDISIRNDPLQTFMIG